MEINYPNTFHSSSSSTPQDSHLSLLNMMNSHAQNNLRQQFVHVRNPNSGYMGPLTTMENTVPDSSYVIEDINSIPFEGNLSTNQDDGPQKESNPSKKKGEKKSKKPKYAFQTRSQVDILDDGYRWRKYGQKAVKNNKFPRSYYRCTHQGCNVKKQVQRLSRDESVVVTTYEGMHSHPIEKSTDNFEHILSQMQIYSPPF